MSMIALLIITVSLLGLRCLSLLLDIHLNILLMHKQPEVLRNGARTKRQDLFVDGWF